MKTNEDLILIYVKSKAESDAATWSKILECINSGVDIFSPFKTQDGLVQDPSIYFAINLCNANIVSKLLKFASDRGKTIDLSYHSIDIARRKITGESDERYEWNVLQHAAVFSDIAVIKVLCEYAKKHNQNPLELLEEKINMGRVQLSVTELMIGTLSPQICNMLDSDTYPPEEQSRLRKKLIKWYAGLDSSLDNEFNSTNPLQLRWDGRCDALEYLIRNKYIDLKSITTTSKPFYEWLNLVSINPSHICKVIRAHSNSTLNNIRVFKTEDENIQSFGSVTATGQMKSIDKKFTINVIVGIDLRSLNKIVKDAMNVENKEIERQQKLEELKATAPKSEVRRLSFEKAKQDIKEVADTVANISEVRIKRYNNGTKSFAEKICFNTVYQTILAHMSARKLTTTELLDATPVTANARIGQMLQTTFSIAMSASSLPGGQVLPEITKVFLNISTKNHANKQSTAVFNAYLVSNVESMLLDLSETLTAEIMNLYHNQRDTAQFNVIASEVSKLTVKNVDKDLINTEINDEEQLFNFMLKQALISLATQGKKDKADPFALHTLETKIRKISSTGLAGDDSNPSSGSDREHLAAISDIEKATPPSKSKKKKSGGGRCSVS